MSRLGFAVLMIAPLSACGDDASSGGGTSVAGDDNAWVEAHNRVRAATGAAPSLSPLTWSADLAKAASDVAKQCTFQHSSGAYGENLFAGSSSTTEATVVDAWAAERANYDAASGTCKKSSCGHYTQIVWRSTARIGCAFAACGGQIGTIAVCEYDPPGNYVGEKAF